MITNLRCWVLREKPSKTRETVTPIKLRMTAAIKSSRLPSPTPSSGGFVVFTIFSSRLSLGCHPGYPRLPPGVLVLVLPDDILPR